MRQESKHHAKTKMSLDHEWQQFVTKQLSTKVEYDNIPKPIVQDPTFIENDEEVEFSELTISTKTKVLFLNQPVDINTVFWQIPMVKYWEPTEGIIKKQMKVVSKDPEEYAELQRKLSSIPYYTENVIKQINNPTARRIKFKDERKITIGIARKDIVNSRCKAKNAFYNCFAMIMRFRYDNKFKEIHVKVFNTGKLEIPGVINSRLLDLVKSHIENVIQPHLPDPIIFIENINFDNVLINSNFNTGFFINRDKLHAIFRSDKYGIESAFDPCSYPGIKCKFYFNNQIGFSDISKQNGRILSEDRHMKMNELIDSKKYTEISFMVFRTGSGLIVGNCTDKILFHVFDCIKRILQAEYLNVRATTDKTIAKDKTLRLRKRYVSVSPEYYSSFISNQRQNCAMLVSSSNSAILPA